MNEEASMYIEDAEDKMKSAVLHFEGELAKIRAGKATPAILSGISVDYYGNSTPLNQVANVGTTDARTIVVQPWEKTMVKAIEKAIIKAEIGVAPNSDGICIRLIFPPLTEERRREISKDVKKIGEDSKVVIRNARRDMVDGLKKLEKSEIGVIIKIT